MVESQDSRVACHYGFNDSGLRLFGVLLSRPSEVRWFDNSRRNVRSRGILWCVSFPILRRSKAKATFIPGSVYGAFQGYARAFYAELLPPGEEARWYGLFSITDKVRISNLLRKSQTITSRSNN
jgi:Vacuole effluxer Atg22 like